jgi:ABC-type branched-subunit amino acid transport system permease subunit
MEAKSDLAKNADQPRKFRISPLNFATAGFFILAGYIWINGAKITGSPYEHWSGTITWIFVLFGVVVSLLDIIFRNFFAETKKLWIVELSFITLVAIIFLIVK